MEIRLGTVPQQRQYQCGDILDCGWVRFDSDHATMLGQGQYHPVAEVFVQRDECSLLAHGAFENQGVVCTRLAGFRSPRHVVPARAQEVGQVRPQHLVEVEAHSGLDRVGNSDLRVEDGLTSIIQGGLNVGARQFRIAAQDRFPRLARGQLLQENRDGNPRSFDHGLAAADARIDLNSLAHAAEDTGKPSEAQASNKGTARGIEI